MGKKGNDGIKQSIIPGYRTGVRWKKAIAVVGYILLLFTLLAMIMPPDYGSTADKVIEVIYNVIIWCVIILVPFILVTNFLGIRDKLPLFKRHRVKYTLLGIVAVYLLIGVMGAIASSAANAMYSEEYKNIRAERAQQRKDEQEAKELAKLREKEEEEALIAKEQEQEQEQRAKEEAAQKSQEAESKENAKEETDKVVEEKKSTENEQETTDNNKNKEAEEKSQTNVKAEELEENLKQPYYSYAYRDAYLESNNISVYEFIEYSVVEKYLSITEKEPVPVKLKSSWGNYYYQKTPDESDIYYVGEMKDNKPQGIGMLFRVAAATEVKNENGDIKLDVEILSMRREVNEDELIFFRIYAGYFKEGQFEGFGMLYKTPLDDDLLKAGGSNIAGFYESVKETVQESVLYTCNPLVYEGEFSKGMFSGKGNSYEYWYNNSESDLSSIAGYEEYENNQEGSAREEKIAEYLNGQNKDIFVANGEFSKDKKHGKVKEYEWGLLSFDGTYKKGEQTGKAKIYYPCSTQLMFKGQVINGRYTEGTLYNEDGSINYEGEF